MKIPLTLIFAFIAACCYAQPSISQFAPASGKTGSPVTIDGAGFNAVAANNIVYFGATRAIVSTATTTHLSVIVPKGATYSPISVTNAQNGLTAFSALSFNVTYGCGHEIDTSLFAAKLDSAATNDNRTIYPGDIDGDGKTDLVFINMGSNTVSIYRNTSYLESVSFESKASIATGTGPYGGALGDLDGDGRLDIVVVNSGSNTVSVYRNISTPGSLDFASREDFITGNGPEFVALGDVDGDGRTDMAVTNFLAGTVSIFRNSGSIGNISFDTKVDYVTGNGPGNGAFDVHIAEMDNDGKLEVLVSNFNNSNISVIRNISTVGNISLVTGYNLNTVNGTYDFSIGDFDGDLKNDIAIVNYNAGSVSIMRNTSSPGVFSFANDVTYAAAGGTRYCAINDIDGNGAPDLLVVNSYADNVIVYENNCTSGTISMLRKADITCGDYPLCVTSADIDGDGVPDIITSNPVPATISIIRSKNGKCPPPKVISFSPADGPVGTTVTINGENFDPVSANNIVFFGPVKANVTAATNSQLSVTVPYGASFERLTVTNSITGLTGFSSYPFIQTFACGGTIDSNSFAHHVDYATGNSPYSCAAGDIDGDGRPDIAVVNRSSQTVSIFRNISSSGNVAMAAKIDLPTESNPSDVLIKDMDGDGKPELIVVCTVAWWQCTVSVYKNLSSPGNISFAERVNSITGNQPYHMLFDDVDRDGKPDIITVNYNSNSFSVLRNISTADTILFGSRTDFATATRPYSISIGDIDGDTISDIVVVCDNSYVADVLMVYRNLSEPGMVNFAGAVTYATNNDPYCVRMGDLNKDGKSEVLCTTSGNVVQIFRNSSTVGVISLASTDFPLGCVSAWVFTGDLDGDSKIDMAVTGNGDSVTVFRNISDTATISFDTSFSFQTGYLSQNIISTDIDGDERPDIITTNNGSESISILRNTIYNPLPVPDSAASIAGPAQVCAGQTFVIYSVAPILNAASYSWSLPPGVHGSSSTNTITVNFDSTAVSGSIGVSGINSCHAGIASNLSVTVDPIPAKPHITLYGDSLLSDYPSGNQWYDQNGPISGAVNQSYMVTANGDYYVIVTVSGCSSSPSNHILVNITSTSVKTDFGGVVIYPNPFYDELIIDGVGERTGIEIYNSTGSLIYRGELNGKTFIRTTGFTAGILLVKLYNEQNISCRKIVKYRK